MDRRSLLTGALGGAAGAVVARELGATVSAAADVDRSEFEALKARVAYLEQFHPPMPPPHVPKFSGTVSIPEGFVVPFGETWDFDPDVSTTVEVAANVVVAGTLQMRPANPGVVHTLRFLGINETAVVGGGMSPIASDVGLWVVGAGVLDAVGSAKTSWTRPAGSVPQGATSVTLAAAPTGWRNGDTVAFTPTAAGKWDQYDTATVTMAGAVATLSAPTAFAHPATTVGPGFTLTGEALNLTRNVVIEGTPTGRAHVFINSSVPQHLAFVELRHLGPRKVDAWGTYAGITGRYPLHFHMMGDAARGSTVEGVVAHTCGHRAFVTHESHGVTYTGCIAHNTADEPYWWDPLPSVTKDITYDSCVASLIAVIPGFRGFRLSGFQLGAGTGNRIFDCVAVGVQGNVNASGFHWPEGSVVNVWEFARCISHNNKVAGFFTWQNDDEVHLVEDFVCYHNSGEGIQHGAYVNSYRYRNGWLYGNKVAAVNLTAVTAGTVPLVFESLHVDCAGQSTSAFVAAHHNGQTTIPTQVRGCVFTGHSGATFLDKPVRTDGYPSLVDFIESGPVTVAWDATARPASVVRVQHAGTATSYAPAGSSAIAPFGSWSGSAPTPFTVKQAA